MLPTQADNYLEFYFSDEHDVYKGTASTDRFKTGDVTRKTTLLVEYKGTMNRNPLSLKSETV